MLKYGEKMFSQKYKPPRGCFPGENKKKMSLNSSRYFSLVPTNKVPTKYGFTVYWPTVLWPMAYKTQGRKAGAASMMVILMSSQEMFEIKESIRHQKMLLITHSLKESIFLKHQYY